MKHDNGIPIIILVAFLVFLAWALFYAWQHQPATHKPLTLDMTPTPLAGLKLNEMMLEPSTDVHLSGSKLVFASKLVSAKTISIANGTHYYLIAADNTCCEVGSSIFNYVTVGKGFQCDWRLTIKYIDP